MFGHGVAGVLFFFFFFFSCFCCLDRDTLGGVSVGFWQNRRAAADLLMALGIRIKKKKKKKIESRITK